MQWQNPLNRDDDYRKLVFFLMLIALLSLAFQVRFVNSLSLIALLAVTLFRQKGLLSLRTAFINPFFTGCFALVLMQAVGLFYTDNVDETIRKLTLKAGLVAIPFFFCSGYNISLKERKLLFYFFNAALVVVTLICLLFALIDYNYNHDRTVFFYHRLLSPFSLHAIYFSFYLFFCIVFWIERGLSSEDNKILRGSIVTTIAYNVILILLLSSKLVIGIVILYFLYALTRVFLKKRNLMEIAAGALFMLFLLIIVFRTNNPVQKRFSDITNGSLNLLKQEKFSPDMYFNGLQLRLLNWRFTYEILKEENAWLIGVGPGDAFQKLNEKYLSMNMYKGEADSGKGYLSYNCHNQFLETLLQSGAVGLFLMIWIVVALFWWINRAGSMEAWIVALSILALSFAESLLETQYGIFLFSFFPLLALRTADHRKSQ